MTRLIDANELKKNLHDAYEEYDGYNPSDLMRFAERVDDEIDNAPTKFDDKAFSDGYTQGTLDAMHAHERPKGEWILKEPDYDNEGGNHLYECKNCHHYDTHSGSIEVPYCWFCGADMREADDDNKGMA